jgi:hypothetical protein
VDATGIAVVATKAATSAKILTEKAARTRGLKGERGQKKKGEG